MSSQTWAIKFTEAPAFPYQGFCLKNSWSDVVLDVRSRRVIAMLLRGFILLALMSDVKGQFEYEEPLLYDTFPSDFVWGVATSAYQVNVF